MVKRRIQDQSTEPYPTTKAEDRLGTQRSCYNPYHYIHDALRGIRTAGAESSLLWTERSTPVYKKIHIWIISLCLNNKDTGCGCRVVSVVAWQSSKPAIMCWSRFQSSSGREKKLSKSVVLQIKYIDRVRLNHQT